MLNALKDAQERVREEDAGKWDTLAPCDEIVLENGRLTLPRLTSQPCPQGWMPTPWAAAQMCQRLCIPTAYFRRCPPDLQDAQFNYWLTLRCRGSAADRKERWLLRTRGEKLRGVLSERYAALDNHEVLQYLRSLWEDRFQVIWFALTDESLHIRIVDPLLHREVLPRDRLVAGLHIANSEVGKRAVTVDALVYRLVCSNGLVRLVKGRSLLYQRHVALSRSGFEAALETAVREAFIQGAGFIERLSQATSETIPDMEGAIQALAERWDLSDNDSRRIRQALLSERSGQQETLYGLVNAVTHAAQSLPPDDRYDMEALAGMLAERGIERKGAVLPDRRGALLTD